MHNKNSSDLVSVVMATYNGERFISEQIESIISQSHQNIQLIIQDDCSTDRTVEIIRTFESRISLSLVVNDARVGFVKNFERAISRAEGEYVALCDQDDVWTEVKIATLINEIADVDLIHSDCELIDENGETLAHSWKSKAKIRHSAREFLFYNDVTGCTALFRRKLLVQCLPFPDGLAYHDWWFAICAATQNGIKYLDQPLVRYRQHGMQDTGAYERGSFVFLSFLKKFRIFSRASKRVISMKQAKNVRSGQNYLKFHLPKKTIDDALTYHDSLSSGFFHWRAFWIGLSNTKTVRPNDGLAYIKILTNDLLG